MKAEGAPNESKKDKKKLVKDVSSMLGGVLAGKQEAKDEKQEAGKPELSAFDKMLADLAIKRQERPDAGEEAKESEQEASETAGETPEQDAASGEYVPWPNHELTEVQLGGGETVVELGGNRSVAERVRDLVTEETPAEQEPAEQPPTFAEPLQWRSQPEQQHQQADFEPTPEEPTTSGAGGGGEVPPTEPPGAEWPSFDDIPEPAPYEPAASAAAHESSSPEPAEPAEIYRQYLQREAAARQTAVEQAASQTDVEDALRRATRAGRGQALGGGLVVAAVEHFKHRRREKRLEKRDKAKSRQLETSRANYEFGVREQEKQRSAVDTRLTAAERQLQTAEQRAAEQARHYEQATKEAQGSLQVPAEHRLQQSAWHTIEVDAKTGKPVENPAFQYGHEYYRERAAETTPAAQTAAGSTALAGATDDTTRPSGVPGNDLPIYPQVPSATTRGLPSATQQQATGSSNKADDSEPTTRLWPYVVTLIIVVVLLIIVAS